VPHVLPVAARKLGDPVSLGITVKGDDGLLHAWRVGAGAARA
jgi:hypothetical protein